MSKWVYRGLRTGIVTTRYPGAIDEHPGVSPGFPAGHARGEGDPGRVVDRCPTGALARIDRRIVVDAGRCVHSFRCVRGVADPLPWQPGYEWATMAPRNRGQGYLFGSRSSIAPPAPGSASLTPISGLGHAFARSLHLRVVDAGDCGACLHEVKQLNNPYYNAHRLGFFITPAPRQADILLVVGPGTDQTRRALEKVYAAMPGPRLVVAVGACALSGGVFGPSFTCSAGVGSIIPVDVEVPGNPPPPLAILHALLVATGRALPAPPAYGMDGAASAQAEP